MTKKILISDHPSYKYALGVVNKEIIAPKYVIKQCKEFLDIANESNDKYQINNKLLGKIDKILKNLVMAKGKKMGKIIYNSLAGYQWLLIVASLCVVYRDNPQKRRYQTIILEIARKNGKTFIVALLLLLLFYIEPKFSKFFSVAPDGALAKEIKEALEPLMDINSDILDKKKSFKILRDSIVFKAKNSKWIPLNYSINRMDSREPNVYIADEVGALPSPYPIEAMKSGQILLRNRLGFIISTKYPTIDNPMEDEVEDAKNVLDNVRDDESIFALLFEPDDIKNWTNNDDIILQSNPLAIEDEELFEDLKRKRQKAIDREKLRENFLTKHCNIIYQGQGTEAFIDVTYVQKCKVEKINWNDKNLYIGVDLSMSNDNCSVAILAYDEEKNKVVCDCVGFIPEGRIDEKNKTEQVDYRLFINAMKCIACGDLTVDYSVIEDFVFNIERKYGGTIIAIGYDRYNALSSAQKWDKEYNTVQIRQHSDTLHPPTKLLYELIMDRNFEYENNKLLEINFQNAKCTFDTNMNRFVNKKKSKGKVDMVISIINALYLLQQDVILDSDSFVVQI